MLYLALFPKRQNLAALPVNPVDPSRVDHVGLVTTTLVRSIVDSSIDGSIIAVSAHCYDQEKTCLHVTFDADSTAGVMRPVSPTVSHCIIIANRAPRSM